MAISTLPNSYTNVAQIFATAPEVGSNTAVTSSLIEQAIGLVEAEINQKLSKVYDLPFSVEIPMLQVLATRMTLCELLGGTLNIGSRIDDTKHPLLANYCRARGDLRAIVKGETSLVDNSGQVIADRVSANAVVVSDGFEDYAPTFLGTDFIESEIDPDFIDDQLDRKSSVSSS